MNTEAIEQVGRNIDVPRRDGESDERYRIRMSETIARWFFSLPGIQKPQSRIVVPAMQAPPRVPVQ